MVNLFPIPVSLEKNLLPFRSNWNDCCFTTGAMNFPSHLVTVLSTTAQFKISVSGLTLRSETIIYSKAERKEFITNWKVISRENSMHSIMNYVTETTISTNHS